MPLHSSRPQRARCLLPLLIACALASPSMAANLLAPSISASRDQQIDTWMPPLLRTAATT